MAEDSRGAATRNRVSSRREPEWYSSVFREGQPNPDATERALFFARDRGRYDSAIQMGQILLGHMQRMAQLNLSRS